MGVNSGSLVTEVPTYAYRCEAGHEFEVVQSITDDALKSCSVCGAPVRRMVFPVGIVFKGQGFYKTDSRSSTSSSIGPGTKEKSTADTKTTESSAESKPDSSSKPEAAQGGAATVGGTSSAGEKNG